MIFIKIAFLSCLFLCSNAFAQTPLKANVINVEIVLGLDKNFKLLFTPDPQIQIGDNTIVTYTLIPQRREITLKGLKAGITNVTIRNTVGEPKIEYKVKVTTSAKSETVQKIRELIGDVEGIEIGVKADEVFVGGQIIVPSDIGRVAVVLDKFPTALRMVELAPQTQVVIAKKMQEEIQRQNMKDVTVRVINSSFILEGIVSSASLRAKADSIAKLMLPNNIQNLASFSGRFQAPGDKVWIQNYIGVSEKKSNPPPPKMMKITAQFVELIKEYNRIFGFSWNPAITDGGGSIQIGKTNTAGVITKSNSSLSATISNLFPKLASAKQAGFARIIQSGVIIVKEGVAGKIQKSETIRFNLGSGDFTRSSDASAGFEVNVKASSLPNELVEMELGISVSVNEGSPPKTLDNKLQTTIAVKSKESAVVGGIVQNKTSTDYDKNPPFGQAQADGGDDNAANSQVFSFLKSKNHTKTKSQFVVFITPEILESASQGTDEIKRKFRRRGR